MPYIYNDTIKIHYELIGSGEPLVMLHPNGHCIKDWYSLHYITQLEKKFQLILIDGRGFGESDKPHDPSYYQPLLIASDTIAVMNHLKIKKAHCFGYSMGGRQAFALMHYYPEYFNSFIIGGAHPYTVNKLLDSYTSLLKQGLPTLVETFEKKLWPFPLEVKNNFLNNDVMALLAMNTVPLLDFSEVLLNYTGPVSFIVGEKDPILNYVKQAQHAKQGSIINIVPEANHMQLFFDADKVTPLLMDYMLD